MNPMATKPFTVLNPYLSIPGLAKTLRPSCVAISLSYAINPLHIFQEQAPPPHPAFWNAIEREPRRWRGFSLKSLKLPLKRLGVWDYLFG